MKTEMLLIKIFLALKLSEGVFILLINVKMPTLIDLLALDINEQDKFQAQLSRAEKKFENIWARL